MNRLFLIVVVVMCCGFSESSWADPASAVAELPELIDVRYEKCPIMGGPIRDEFAAIHEGKVFHFCCAACIETFKKNPEAVIAKIDGARSFRLEITNRSGACPVTGKPATRDFFLIRGNTVTFYCCPDCVGKDNVTPAPVELHPHDPGADEADQKTGSGTPVNEKPADCEGDCSNCPGCPGS
jgi:YHS domain-containing protein